MKKWIETRKLHFWWFVVLGWVIISFNNLDGVRDVGHVDEFSLWRFMAAWYVFIFGIVLLTHLVVHVPSWIRTVSWACFGAGMMFWATAASSGWPLWVCTGFGAWYMSYRVAKDPIWDDQDGN